MSLRRQSISVAGLLAALPIAALSGPAGAAAIDGVWRTEPRESGAYITVRIRPCAADPAMRCGVVAGAHAGAGPELVGAPILRDMQRQEDGSWGGGEILRPLEGTAYSSRLRLADGGVLEVEGCVVGGLVCRTQEWSRVQ